MQGKPAVYMALGVTSKKRGVYFSHPVYGKGKDRPLGVAVLKSSVEGIEKDLMKSHDGIVFLTDPHGVVFVSSRADWLYQVLWKASYETISDISGTKQFGKGPWKWTGVELVGEDIAVDSLGNEYHVHQQELTNYTGWHLVYLHNHYEVTEKIIAPLRKSVGVGVAVLCVFIGLIVFFLFIQAYTGIIRRKKAAEELRESEEKYRNLYEKTPVMLHSIDSQGRMLSASNHWLEVMGYTEDEVIGLKSTEFFTEASKKYAIEVVLPDFFKNGYCTEIPYEFIKKNGETIDVLLSAISEKDDSGKLIRSLAVSVDVTDRKKAEEAMKESEERYRSLIELNPDSIYVCQEGEIVYANPATIDIMGAKSEDELIGKKIFDLIHPDFREKAKQRYRMVIEKGESAPLMDFIFLRLDEGETHVQAVAAPVMFRGEPSVLSAMRDISEQKKAEAEKTRLEDQLQQAYKMEAIGTLAGGIAHDFNNILTPIIVQTELALMDIDEKSPIRFNLQEVMKAGLRAKDLVKQILTFSRHSEKQPIPLKITPIIKEAVKLLRASLPTTIEIRLNLQGGEGTVNADPTQIHQVLMNLCTNSGHAMRDKGGVLNISLDMVQLDSEYVSRHADLEPGPYLKLSVSDTGHGISPEVLDRIFDPFFTTKDRSEGTGMGLAVVHGIIKNYGGEITVESELGKGATFMVFFPSVKTLVAEEPEVEEELPRGNERVLVVDDERGMIDAIGKMLNHLGYQVVEQTSSVEALKIFEAEPDRFDLVITDQTMPDMSGTELAKIIMQIRLDIPIILCTGFSERVNEESAKAMGISAFVMKPIVMKDIAHTIRKVLDD